MEKDIQQQYIESSKDSRLFFDIFFGVCRKFSIQYSKASEKDRAFVDELTQYMYEVRKAERDGLDTSKIEKPFPIVNWSMGNQQKEPVLPFPEK